MITGVCGKHRIFVPNELFNEITEERSQLTCWVVDESAQGDRGQWPCGRSVVFVEDNGELHWYYAQGVLDLPKDGEDAPKWWKAAQEAAEKYSAQVRAQPWFDSLSTKEKILAIRSEKQARSDLGLDPNTGETRDLHQFVWPRGDASEA